MLLQARGLTKRFPGTVALDDVGFELVAGEVHALLGENGAGKSTLIKCLTGAYRRDGGDILLDGRSVLQDNPDQLRQRIGMVFQSFNLFPHRTVLDNVTLAPRKLKKLSADEARELGLAQLDRVGLRHKADVRPATLSGGQQQRVFIAQALLDDVQVLLLDEPLASLDLRSQHEIVALISAIHRSRGVTTLIVTHDLNPMISMIDRVLYFLDGHPRCGSIAEVVNADLLSRLYGTAIHVLRTVDGDLFIRGA